MIWASPDRKDTKCADQKRYEILNIVLHIYETMRLVFLHETDCLSVIPFAASFLYPCTVRTVALFNLHPYIFRLKAKQPIVPLFWQIKSTVLSTLSTLCLVVRLTSYVQQEGEV